MGFIALNPLCKGSFLSHIDLNSIIIKWTDALLKGAKRGGLYFTEHHMLLSNFSNFKYGKQPPN